VVHVPARFNVKNSKRFRGKKSGLLSIRPSRRRGTLGNVVKDS
jgi:hypothetical protein